MYVKKCFYSPTQFPSYPYMMTFYIIALELIKIFVRKYQLIFMNNKTLSIVEYNDHCKKRSTY